MKRMTSVRKIFSILVCLSLFLSYVPAGLADEANPLPQTPAAYAASDYARYADKMAGGGDHMAVVRPDGTVAAWGDNTYGQCDVPAGLSNVQAVAAGMYYTMALTGDGQVRCWGGYPKEGCETITIPQEVTDVQGNIKLIAGGGVRLAVVTQDNKVINWSSNGTSAPAVYENMGNIVALAVNSSAGAALDDAGNVTAWGSSSCTTIPDGLNGNAVAIAAGQFNFLALKKDGTVTGWGSSSHVSKSNGLFTYSDNNKNVRALAGGQFFAVALLADGSVRSWGSASPAGGNTTDGNELMEASANVKAISAAVVRGEASGGDTCILRGDGTLAIVGPNNCGQTQTPAGLNLITQIGGSDASLSSLAVTGYSLSPAFDASTTAYTVNIPNEVSSVNITATASDSNAILKSGALAAWSACSRTVNDLAEGDNPVTVEVTAADGTVKAYTITIKRAAPLSALPQTPAEYAASDYARYGSRMAVGEAHLAVINANGTVMVGGDNTYGQRDVPAELSGAVVKAVAAGSYHTLALAEDGRVFAWGSCAVDSAGTLGAISLPSEVAAAQGSLKLVAAGSCMSAVVTDSNHVIVWGRDSSQLGTIPDGLGDIAAIGLTNNCVVVLNDEGNVTVLGNTACSTVPDGLNGNAVAIAVGMNHWLALKKDGTVSVTGDNGQLRMCENIKNKENVRAIAGGWQFAGAILADGSVIGWGRVPVGDNPVGDNDVGYELIAAGASIRAFTCTVSGGAGNKPAVCAMQGDGTIKIAAADAFSTAPITEEFNFLTALSNNAELSGLEAAGYAVAPAFNSSVTSYTVDVPNDVTSVSIMATTADAKASLKINGTAVTSGTAQTVNNLAAGDNPVTVEVTAEDGTVKTYTLTIKRAAPVSELPQTPAEYAASDFARYAARMAVGKWHMAAVKPDGTLALWGDNTYGQLDAPAGLSGVKAVAAGTYHTLALKEDGTVVGWGTGYDSSANLVPFAGTIPAELQGVKVKSIAAGSTMSAAVKEDGGVVAWGYNSTGLAAVPAGLGNVVSVAVNSYGVVAVNDAGNVTVWGDSSCTTGAPAGNVVSVAAGTWHWLALKSDGTVAIWGNSSHVSSCDGIASQENVRAIGAGRMLAAALLADGSLQGWGMGSSNVTGLNDCDNVKAFTAGAISEKNGVASNVCVLQEDGTVLALGPDSYGQTDVPAGLNLLEGGNKGDVNGDGGINILDVVGTVNIVLGKITPDENQLYAADMNSDGGINILDVVRLVKSILGV